jgi:hypothetical protein
MALLRQCLIEQRMRHLPAADAAGARTAGPDTVFPPPQEQRPAHPGGHGGAASSRRAGPQIACLPAGALRFERTAGHTPSVRAA